MDIGNSSDIDPHGQDKIKMELDTAILCSFLLPKFK